MKVWIISNNGSVNEEIFTEDQEASSHAKTQSERPNTYCAIFETGNKKVFFYENGTLANPRRRKELAKGAEEMLLHQFSREQGSNGVKRK